MSATFGVPGIYSMNFTSSVTLPLNSVITLSGNRPVMHAPFHLSYADYDEDSHRVKSCVLC